MFCYCVIIYQTLSTFIHISISWEGWTDESIPYTEQTSLTFSFCFSYTHYNNEFENKTYCYNYLDNYVLQFYRKIDQDVPTSAKVSKNSHAFVYYLYMHFTKKEFSFCQEGMSSVFSIREVSSMSSLGVDEVKLEYCFPWKRKTLPLEDLARLYRLLLSLPLHFDVFLHSRIMFSDTLTRDMAETTITVIMAFLKYTNKICA